MYLEGVVKVTPKQVSQLQELLKKPEFILLITKEAAGRIFSSDFLVNEKSGYYTALQDFTTRCRDTLSLLVLAHHMVFDCSTHFAREDHSMFLRYYMPQAHARHTQNYLQICTKTELDDILRMMLQVQVRKSSQQQALTLANQLAL